MFIKPLLGILLVSFLVNGGLYLNIKSLRKDKSHLSESLTITASKYSELYKSIETERQVHDKTIKTLENLDRENDNLVKKNKQLRSDVQNAIKNSKDSCLDQPVDESIRMHLNTGE